MYYFLRDLLLALGKRGRRTAENVGTNVPIEEDVSVKNKRVWL
jgi:hypothetical protein